jgi:mannose-1-phosphate guanylyltransferase
MEKTDKIVAYPLELGWSDVGIFLSFEDLYDQDEKRNTVVGSSF